MGTMRQNDQRHRAAGDDAFKGSRPDRPRRCRRWLHTIRVPLATGRRPLGVHLFRRAPSRPLYRDSVPVGCAGNWVRHWIVPPIMAFCASGEKRVCAAAAGGLRRNARFISRTAPGTRAGCRRPGTRDESHVTAPAAPFPTVCNGHDDGAAVIESRPIARSYPLLPSIDLFVRGWHASGRPSPIQSTVILLHRRSGGNCDGSDHRQRRFSTA